MQRILFITDSLMAGGTEQQLVELVTHLDRKRFEPSILCLYGERAGRSLHFLPALRDLEIPVVLLDLGWSAKDKLSGIYGIVRAVWLINPQIVQAVNYHGNLLVRLARPILPRSVKLIGCVYVAYTHKQLLYERLSSWLCAVIVCNSPYLQRQLQKHIPSERIRLIFNGINLQRFTQNPDPLFRSRNAPEADCVLLFIGRITKQKAPHLIVEALGLLKKRSKLPLQVCLWIVGESEENDEQVQLEHAIERYGLENVVSQFPATTLPELYYHAADVIILSSLWEGLPNVMLEALAVGRPVVISDDANSAGVIAHGINGWVFPTGDSEQLADLLWDVIALSGEELAGFSGRCRQYAASFSVEKMVEGYEALYESLSARS